MAKHPGKIGSTWTGKGYVHGPRKHQPSGFSAWMTTKPDAEGKKKVLGKSKSTGKWEEQSTLTPRKIQRVMKKRKNG
jgi:hypothetical protein